MASHFTKEGILLSKHSCLLKHASLPCAVNGTVIKHLSVSSPVESLSPRLALDSKAHHPRVEKCTWNL